MVTKSAVCSEPVNPRDEFGYGVLMKGQFFHPCGHFAVLNPIKAYFTGDATYCVDFCHFFPFLYDSYVYVSSIENITCENGVVMNFKFSIFRTSSNTAAIHKNFSTAIILGQLSFMFGIDRIHHQVRTQHLLWSSFLRNPISQRFSTGGGVPFRRHIRFWQET